MVPKRPPHFTIHDSQPTLLLCVLLASPGIARLEFTATRTRSATAVRSITLNEELSALQAKTDERYTFKGPPNIKGTAQLAGTPAGSRSHSREPGSLLPCSALALKTDFKTLSLPWRRLLLLCPKFGCWVFQKFAGLSTSRRQRHEGRGTRGSPTREDECLRPHDRRPRTGEENCS